MVKKTNRIIGVDFDGTLSNTVKWPVIGEPIQEVFDYILREQEKGAYVILITMREGIFLRQAIDWCEQHGLIFDAVNDNLPHMKAFYEGNPRKIFCTEYIDDMNFGGIDLILQRLREEKDES